VGLAHGQQLVPDPARAAEGVDPAFRDLRHNEQAIKPPEQPRRGFRRRRVVPALAHGDRDVVLASAQHFEEIQQQRGRLLQVGGDHPHVGAAGCLHPCADRRERAEVAHMQQQLRRERGPRERLGQLLVAAVRAGVDDEDELHRNPETPLGLLRDRGELPDQVRDELLVAIDREDDGVEFSSRH
jgi:hypothetical protein